MSPMRRPVPGAKPAMLAGLVGRVVQTFAPFTEADPAAIAVQFLVALGNAVGRGPCFHVGETPHHTNEFLALVGRSSRARKGDSKNAALRSVQDADPVWAASIASGLSSGEGLIYAVRDVSAGTPPDPGILDKRLLVVETEFATALKQFARDGNILSATLRDAWDGKAVLRTMTRNSPLRATDAHVSIIAHTTPEDLHAYLANVEAANGLGNRFLFVLTDRVQLLPTPGRADAGAIAALGEEVRAVLAAATQVREMRFTRDAEALWRRIYPALTADEPGLIGNLLARAEAHVVRLSALFALSAQAQEIDVPHLESALAFHEYVAASTRRIFAGRSGNDTADRIRQGMLPGQCLTLTEVREQIFSNHIPAPKLTAALRLLETLGEVRVETVPTSGRPEVSVTRLDRTEQRGPTSAGNADEREADECAAS